MLKLSEFLGVPENVEFKLEKDGVDFSNWSYKIQNNILLVKNKVEGSWYQSRVGINKIIRAKIVVTPKEILTDKEKEYLKCLIKYYKSEASIIFKDDNGISIAQNNGNGLFDKVLTFKITKNLPFKNMVEDYAYPLSDLGL